MRRLRESWFPYGESWVLYIVYEFPMKEGNCLVGRGTKSELSFQIKETRLEMKLKGENSLERKRRDSCFKEDGRGGLHKYSVSMVLKDSLDFY